MKLEETKIKIEKTKRRKTISIFIERDGSVRMLVPINTTPKKIKKVIESKKFQIFSKIALWKELNEGFIERKFVSGQSFLYLGRNIRLFLVDNQDEPLKYKNGNFLLNKKNKLDAKKYFIEFYKKKAEKKINERLKLISEKFFEKPSSIKVLDLKNRWASCTSKKTLNFHWKCAMAPVSVIDYIITHEMVHLKNPNHSPEFWNELDKKMPDYRSRADWLRRNGIKMNL